MYQLYFLSRRPNNLFYQCENRSARLATAAYGKKVQWLTCGYDAHSFWLCTFLWSNSKNGHHHQADRVTESTTLTYLCMCFASAEIDGLTRSWARFVISAVLYNPAHLPSVSHWGGRSHCILGPVLTNPLPSPSFARDKIASFWAWLAEYAKLFNPVTTNYEQMLECLQSDRT